MQWILLLSHPILERSSEFLGGKKTKSEEGDQKPKAMATSSSSDSDNASNYLILDPYKGNKRDIVKFLVTNNYKNGMRFFKSSDKELKGEAVVDHRWLVLLSLIIIRFLNFLDTPVRYIGYGADFIMNFLIQNNGFFGVLRNLLHGSLKIPKRGADNFISSFGLFDGRVELFKNHSVSQETDESIVEDIKNIKAALGNKYLMDLCIMASKIAYENEKLIQKVVNDIWNMHFVSFHNGWNDRQKQSSTEFFIFCDKPKDANLIIVSFRGTETFSLQDAITDLDFSWFEISKVGKVHMGFLEALGLGTREDPDSFPEFLKKKHFDIFHCHERKEAEKWAKTRAYYTIVLQLKDLLKEHKKAKFVVTGHSLGGALAIMFPCLLIVQEENDLLDRLLNIYTFGQPRVGDERFAIFMEAHLNYPDVRYFRVVYSNDLVPRIPFDDRTFSYKHFGTCVYYNSRYFGKFMDEQPNKNYFKLRHFLPMTVNAIWELVRSFFIGFVHGQEYKETWFNTFFRLLGLLVPGISAHSPVDYINSVRLGRERVAPLTSLARLLRNL